ncbi:MAG TPA: MlaD family protein, partial [Solirubrobacteraceae bacterium]|nr:MlaD family protein [Solirubrobacteraceae bacterium]
MTKDPITLRRLAVVALFSVSCFLLLLVLWTKIGGPTPLKASGYRVHILLPQARGLGAHSDVRVSGVTVGHVISVKVAKPERLGRADVVIELARPFAPLRTDATARLRQKSILGESVVALSLGNSSAPPIPENGTLDARRAQSTVEPDQIFDSFDPRTRRALQTWQQTEGGAIEDTGDELNAAVGTFRPWAVDATALLSIVEQQGADVQALVRDGGAIAHGLADRGDALRLLARSGDVAFNATGRQAVSLRAAFQELPGFEAEARQTLQRLTRLADASTGNVRTLTGQLAPFSDALQALSTHAPALDTALSATPALANASDTGIPALERVLDRTPPFLRDLDPYLRSFNPTLRYIGNRRGDLGSFIANAAGATQGATATTKGNEPLHYLRAMPALTPIDLAPLTRRPGINRASAYPLADAATQLLRGLQVYDDRNCSASTPAVSDKPSPYLDQQTRDQISLYAYAPDIQHLSAPPCRLQGA